jgi:lycopene cyclase domain-containing protein
VKEGILLAIAILFIGGLWDSYAILKGYWSFKEEFFIGINIGVMPLEEYLFMLIIPFLVLVLYRIVTRKNYC